MSSTAVSKVKTGTIGTTATEQLTGANELDTDRSGVIIRNTSAGTIYALVSDIYTAAGNLTSATGMRIGPGGERVLSANGGQRVWLLGSDAGLTFAIEQFRGPPPGDSMEGEASILAQLNHSTIAPATYAGAAVALTASTAIKLFSSRTAGAKGWRVYNPNASINVLVKEVTSGATAPTYAQMVAGYCSGIVYPKTAEQFDQSGNVDVYACAETGTFTIYAEELI